MVENSNSNSFSLVKIDTPQFLENALSEPAKEVGHTLANIFHAIFGPINYPIQKYRLRQAANLKQYENDIQEQLSKIPEEKLIEPPLSIVGPALEASKYYIEEDALRIMFSKLIASAMNSDNVSTVHPAFVEIIKQLSPLDAQNLEIISQDIMPLTRYKLMIKSGGHTTFQDNVFVSNPYEKNIDLNAASITNLDRLGLINIDFSNSINNNEAYKPFNDEPLFLSLSMSLEHHPEHSFDLQKGIVKITPLGRNFSTLCF